MAAETSILGRARCNRADLLDAYTSIEWGETELPLFASKFHAWKNTNTGIAYINADTGKKVAIFRKHGHLPSILNAGVGSIINSFRTALDLLASALAKRNGATPSRNTHFPIFASHWHFSQFYEGEKRKKWLSDAELRILESVRPYDGGNTLLWSLHQLDIARKHERLLTIAAEPSQLIIVGTGQRPVFLFTQGQPLEDKTPLFELPADAAEPETGLDFQILFEESSLPAVHLQPVFGLLNEFGRMATDIINLFDT